MDSLLKLLPRLHLRKRESRRSRLKHELSTKQQPIILEGVLDISMEARDALTQEEQSHHESTSAFEIDLTPVSPTPKACCSETPASSSRSSSPRIPHSATSLRRERSRRNANNLTIPPMPKTPPPIPPPRRRTHSPPPSHPLHPYTASDMQRCITFPLDKDYASPSHPPPLPPLPRSKWSADSESLSLARQPEATLAPGSAQSSSPTPSPAGDEEDGDKGECGGGGGAGGLGTTDQQQSQSGAESEGCVKVPSPPPLQESESTTPPGTPWALQLTFPLPPRATFTKRASSRYSGIAQLLPLLGDLEEVGAVEPLSIVKPRNRGSLATVPSDHGIVEGGSSEEPDPPRPVSPVIDELFYSLDDVYAEFKSTEGSDEFMSISLGSGSDADFGDERGAELVKFDGEGSDEFMSASPDSASAAGESKRVSDESESAIRRYSIGGNDSPSAGDEEEVSVAWRFRPALTNCTSRANAPQAGQRERARLERERFLVGHAPCETFCLYSKSKARSLPDLSSP